MATAIQKTKATTMSFSAEPELVGLVDRIIKKTGAYHSKSEFLRDAARQRIIQLAGLGKEMEKMRRATERLKRKVRLVKELSQEERDKIALNYIKETRQ